MSKIDIDKFVALVIRNEESKLQEGFTTRFLSDVYTLLEREGLQYKDGEIVELSNLEQNGKNSKPANSFQISKDLQELTEFEKAFITSYDAYAEGFFTIMKWRDYAKLKSKQLIEIAYKQFREEENAIVTKQEFYKAVDEEIKRRCEGINVDEMFDKVPPRILKTDFDFYKKGVVDTINKLKGE